MATARSLRPTTSLRTWTDAVRLLIVTNDYPPKPGGIQMYLQSLVDAYPDEVHVVAPADRKAPAAESGVTRGHRRWMLPTKRTRQLVVDAVHDFGPDAILFGAPHPLTSLGPSLRDEFDIPFGVVNYGAEVTLPAAVPGIKQWLGKTLAAADVNFAISRYTEVNVVHLTKKPVVYIGAGVDIDTFVPPANPPENVKPVIGCVSRFVPRKGQDRVVEAASLVEDDVQVMLVGKGRTEQRIRKKAEQLGVDVRFEIDVPWADLAGLYQGMDVFVMPCRSRWGGLEAEGLGLVFLEAAACGVPVIAGNSGGAPETVIPGQTGYIATESKAIAKHLTALLADPQKAAAMGAAGRVHVESEFTWPRVVERVREGFAPHLR
ncbi:MAG: glycosyltransferase family 1 protein [Armatimonadetes bacterium]|nr:MAG: glycosyltransferase family 1 protein [Armatimonadota bacterium]